MFEHFVWQLRVYFSAVGAKCVSWPWLSLLRGWASMTMAFAGKYVYIYLTISSCYRSVPLTLVFVGWDVGLSSLCHSCVFACQDMVLKTSLGLGYLCSNNAVVRLWHLPGKCVCIAHLLILLRVNDFNLSLDREGWWFEHSVSYLRVDLSR